jgi:hypothetical protein
MLLRQKKESGTSRRTIYGCVGMVVLMNRKMFASFMRVSKTRHNGRPTMPFKKTTPGGAHIENKQ